MAIRVPMPTQTVRPADAGDVPEIARLLGELGYPTDTHAMAARLERIARDDHYATFVAENGEGLAGLIGVMWGLAYNYDAPFARIVVLVVDERMRGRGTGAVLVAAAEEWARSAGATSIHLTTASHRDGAHAFYPRMGYAATGTRFYKKL